MQVSVFRPFLFLLTMLLAQSLVAQDSIRVKSIYFGGGSYYIDEEQLSDLHKFIDSIEDPENYQITITSHTDNIGGIAYNKWLSEMRGGAVVEQLIMRFIERERIHLESKGLANPLYDNNTSLGRRANRRVDVIFTPIMY